MVPVWVRRNGIKLRISVIGTGYLGAVHAACMAELGHDVLGVDTDERKIAALAEGAAPFYEPSLAEMLVSAVGSGKLRFTTSVAEAARFAEVHFICVGTPQMPGALSADLSHIESVIEGLVPNLTDDCLVVGKSTVPVGTAAGLAARLAELAPAGVTANLAWNPEFLREGFAVEDTLRPDRLVVGATSAADDAILRAVYAQLLDAGTPYILTDLATAELTKVAANAFLATKISFINAMANVCEAAGANVVTLADALGHDSRSVAGSSPRVWASVAAAWARTSGRSWPGPANWACQTLCISFSRSTRSTPGGVDTPPTSQETSSVVPSPAGASRFLVRPSSRRPTTCATRRHSALPLRSTPRGRGCACTTRRLSTTRGRRIRSLSTSMMSPRRARAPMSSCT